MIPRASIRGSLWRRLRAFLRRRIRVGCGTCAQFTGEMSPAARRMFHGVHLEVEMFERLMRDGGFEARR